jgi:hypothetical protein
MESDAAHHVIDPRLAITSAALNFGKSDKLGHVYLVRSIKVTRLLNSRAFNV